MSTGSENEHVTERVQRIMGRGNGRTILVHIGTNNADKEGTTAIVKKYRHLLNKTKGARVGHTDYLIRDFTCVWNHEPGIQTFEVNGMVKQLCREEEVGFVDLWDISVGKEEMYSRDGLQLNGKWAAVFSERLSGRLPLAWVKYDI